MRERNSFGMRLSGISAAGAPKPSEVEVCIFGPGYGECLVIHIGNDHWIVVDSCLDPDYRMPVALLYLRSLGLEPASAIKLIVATHWHADHFRGIASTLDAAPSAIFALSAALQRDEFLSLVSRFETRPLLAAGSKLEEISQVFRTLETEKATRPRPKLASEGKVLYQLAPAKSGHGFPCQILALSPSDADHLAFLDRIARLLPQVGSLKRPARDPMPNEAAVVVWVTIGDLGLLLGSDLENSQDHATGWTAILNSASRPHGRAVVFKVPHHGSETGHNERVSSELLVAQPLALITPFLRGSKLPTGKDVARIASLTPAAFSSTTVRNRQAKKRSPAVRRQLKESRIRIRRLESSFGAIRLRLDCSKEQFIWGIEMFGEATQLEYAIQQ